MGWVRFEPGFEDCLCRLGLRAADDFLRLQGVILGGHPDRHVMQVSLGTHANPIRAFLKKEHRVLWKHRLANWLSGFGWVSKSAREAQMLLSAAAAGIGCPQVMAHGESRGRAFLLVRQESGLSDLREILVELRDDHERRKLAFGLGRALARMHDAGFDHPDLYAKHVLAGKSESGWQFSILDWQRSRRKRRVSWAERCRDLAALDATLADDLASDRERLACLRSYAAKVAARRSVVCQTNIIRALSLRLQGRRRIRDMRRSPLPIGQQGLIWLDGEALCVTPSFLADVGGEVPAWLRRAPELHLGNEVIESEVSLGGGRRGLLVRRWRCGFVTWLFSLAKRRSFPAPEFERAGMLFRLERQGLVAPRVLAVGHRRGRWPWESHSFLLTEIPEGLPASAAERLEKSPKRELQEALA